jgi:hypothetical protein
MRDQLPDGRYEKWAWKDLPESGLVECVAAGTGGMLIRKKVLTAMPAPWFEVGQVNTERLSEDLHFCTKARGLGFSIYADMDTPIGHTTPMTIWPRGYEGSQHVEADIGQGYVVSLDGCRGDLPE